MKRSGYHRFLVVWAGQLVSALGTGMSGFALGVHVFQETGRVAGFGIVLLSLFLPGILLRPFGGLLADRLDRRLLIIVGDLASATAMLYLLWRVFASTVSVVEIYACLGVSSAFGALQNPAYKAALTDLVSPEAYTKASGLVQLASSAQHLLAPLAAGALLTRTGLPAVLLFDVATFTVALAAAAVLPPLRSRSEGGPRSSILDQLAEGWNVIYRDRLLVLTVMVISLVTFFVGLLQTLFAPMVLAITDSGTLGLMQSISASGMVVGSLLIGIFGLPGSEFRRLPIALFAAGVALALLGGQATPLWITLCFFAFFSLLPVVNSSAEVLIRSRIPNAAQGRAWGLIGFLSQIGYLFAYVGAGVAADFLFTPLLLPDGALAHSVGSLIGVGPGRGVAFMLILAGIGLAITAVIAMVIFNRQAFLSEREGVVQP